MFGKVLLAVKEHLRHIGIRSGIALTTHSPCEHSTRDEITSTTNEKFWSGSHKTCDAECPTGWVLVRERREHATSIKFTIDFANDVTRKNDLV
jgi:hypothetical protein